MTILYEAVEEKMTDVIEEYAARKAEALAKEAVVLIFSNVNTN